MVDVELVKAGVYKVLTPHPEGIEYSIVRTEGWEGPRGGNHCCWEAVYVDGYGHSCIDSDVIPARTLAEARSNFAAFLASL
jgi:hypothetical protein